MKSRLLVSQRDTTWLLVLESGDDVVSELSRVAHEERLDAAHFTAIGALSDATLGWFDPEAREYRHIEIAEQVEVLSLVGDVTGSDRGSMVHAHVVVGTHTGATLGGHLLAARVRPTLEVVLTETPAHLRRRFDPKVGLALIDVDAPESGKG
jgi:predicted DNA-binding protein with PD1-like motif